MKREADGSKPAANVVEEAAGVEAINVVTVTADVHASEAMEPVEQKKVKLSSNDVCVGDRKRPVSSSLPCDFVMATASVVRHYFSYLPHGFA